MKKEKGISVKVSKDFYKMMEQTRNYLSSKHKLKISSHVKLTKLMARKKGIFMNKDWAKEIKKCY